MLNTDLDLNAHVFDKEGEKLSTREAFGKSLLEIAEDNPDIVALTGDLTESTCLTEFVKKYPQRFIEVGIAEQNLAGISAGLALSGKIPFMTSFSIFSPGRNWEQIRQAIAFSNTNVKIVGSHSGYSASTDGASAQALEDIALTRVLPHMTIVSPIDYEQTKKAVAEIAKYQGPVYLRLHREKLPQITTKNTPFSLGKAYTLVEGKDVTLVATGPIAIQAVLAASELKAKYHIHAEVIAVPTIKPLDERSIIKSAIKTKKVVTIEEHQIEAGLGSAVCEVLSENHPTDVLRLGANGTFGESGEYNQLIKKYGLDSKSIVQRIIKKWTF